MSYVLAVPAKILLPASDVSALPGYALWCSATGTSPVYTALMKSSTVLVNRTNDAGILLFEKGNYTCVASNKYGTDVKEFQVALNGENCYSLMAKRDKEANTLATVTSKSSKRLLHVVKGDSKTLKLWNFSST